MECKKTLFSAGGRSHTQRERERNTSWRNDEESRNFLRGRGSGRSIAGEKSNGKIDKSINPSIHQCNGPQHQHLHNPQHQSSTALRYSYSSVVRLFTLLMRSNVTSSSAPT